MAQGQVVLTARIRWGKLRDFGPAISALQAALIKEAADELRHMAPHHLRDKIRITKSTVVIDDPSAMAIEFGARPHLPPIEGLLEWAARKGKGAGAAYRIQRSIGERGLEPRPYMRPAIEAVQARASRVMGDAWQAYFRVPGL